MSFGLLWESSGLQREPIERSHGSTAPGTTTIRRRLWSGMGTDQIEGVTIIIVTINKKTLEDATIETASSGSGL